ncbi:hypothetical protein LOTGIDRAFT_152026 [Lottia gigantea]|uniref:DNA-directed RNA polymerase subunit n=1 Tax=Lottia gigantea TaxID=225164 RepID=V4BH04_LOTGI|nr:hypothetical protein LOTGIDRAFT_152026 [Lottia gigantea]ESP05212.1 hypothetical protein LOTGIDRAFT_152026 [Lottia gigantea]
MDSFSDTDIPIFQLNEIGFRVYSNEEIKALSVKEISYPISFNNLAHPNVNGLYDPSLGPYDKSEVCSTCGQNSFHCPGHLGHIQLALPVYHPLFFKQLYSLLKGTCFECHRLTVNVVDACLFFNQVELLDRGYVTSFLQLSEMVFCMVKDRDLNDMSVLIEIQEFISAFTKKTFQNDVKEKQPGLSHIESCYRLLVNDFIKNMVYMKACPHCKKKKQNIRQENNSKIVLTSKYTKKIAQEKENEKTKIKKKLKPMEDDSSTEGMDLLDMEDPKTIEETKDSEKSQTENISKFFESGSEQTLLTASSVKEHLRVVWKTDELVLRNIFKSLDFCGTQSYPTDVFFLDVVPVPPCRFRPLAFRAGGFSEHHQSVSLNRIIMDNVILKYILQSNDKTQKIDNATVDIEEFAQKALNGIKGNTISEKLHFCWQTLQMHVNSMIDSDTDKYTRSDSKMPGIKQLLEKKSGLFRMHMMGKRVNYACRSVISPDPCLNTNEVGVPLVFATKLSYPQPVTMWNVQELRQAVINGPLVHPGALFVENEDGFLTKLSPKDKLQREALAKQLLTPSSTTTSLLGCKKVYRHLKNGDVMLLNRQPTLHKPSIQAHRARVLPGQKTLRMHYANCKAYNADFDGDEMNAHFPQNEMGRSEAYSLASTDFQYLAPKDGAPLAGLIQDHMVSGVALTIRGRFFNKGDYFNLVYSALSNKYSRVKTLPPSIIKPYQLWSGKQVLSTVLLNVIPDDKPPLSINGTSKIGEKNWDNIKRDIDDKLIDLGESTVTIRHGELLQGVLDKGHYGNTPFGLVHCCFEMYGGNVAGLLLSCLGRLFNAYLKLRGFTLGVADILVTNKANKKRSKIIRKYPKVGKEAIKKALGLEKSACEQEMVSGWKSALYNTIDDRGLREIDAGMKNKTDDVQNKISGVCMPGGLEKKFPDNNLQLMVLSGAKGSMVNCMQISCLLGQIELEGRRPPQMINGSTLPSFLPYDTSPKAGGFVSGRFLTGIRPQEYFFHCMAGREGLVDTAVKTSRSGYLQRCLIKHLEGVIVNYDLSVRDSDGSIVQFYYGDDGLDVQHTPFLQPKQFPFLVQNKHTDSTNTIPTDKSKHKKVKKTKKRIKKWKKSNSESEVCKQYKSGFLQFCCDNCSELTIDSGGNKTQNGRSKSAILLCKKWRELNEEEKYKYEKNTVACPDPVFTHTWPHEDTGVRSEKLDYIIDKYYKENFNTMLNDLGLLEKFNKNDFECLISDKLQQALVQPGEAVGLLCAQSIGEPSTQMTLNTFHFAGRGEMNMTLGIPRLREILMTASENIKTPAMDIPVHNTDTARSNAKDLQKKLSKVRLSEVMKDIQIKEELSIEGLTTFNRYRKYKIHFEFLSPECYRDKMSVKPHTILFYIEQTYINQLVDVIRKQMGLSRKSKLVDTGNVRVQEELRGGDGGKDDNDNDDDDLSSDDDDDGDATAMKQKERKRDTQEYVGEENEKEEAGISDEDNDEDNDDNVNMKDGKIISDDDKSDNENTSRKKTSDVQKQSANARIQHVLASNPAIVDYKYDTKKQLWCEFVLQFSLSDLRLDIASVVQDHVKKSVLHSVRGINQTYLSEEKEQGETILHLKTEGINFQEVYKYADILDLNKLYSNNFKLFSQTYGIEASARIIQQELKNVFGAYGIYVDHRHLSLLSDFMTFEGNIRPFNRIGIKNNSSPLLKMTYETTMAFMVDSSIHSNVDRLKTPSSRIIAGQLVSCGTGSFDVLQPLK